MKKTGATLEATAQELDHVLASAGGRSLRYREVLDDVRAIARGRGGSHSAGPRIKTEVAWARVDRMLLENEAMARGLGNAPEIQPALWQYEQAALAQALIGKVRTSVPSPSDAEVLAFFERHAADYAHPARRPCAHILYESRGEAAEAARRIAGGAGFEDLARAESLDNPNRSEAASPSRPAATPATAPAPR